MKRLVYLASARGLLFRWLELSEFREAYLQARRQAFGQASAPLQQATFAAVSVLLTLDVGRESDGRESGTSGTEYMAAKALELEDIEMRFAPVS